MDAYSVIAGQTSGTGTSYSSTSMAYSNSLGGSSLGGNYFEASDSNNNNNNNNSNNSNNYRNVNDNDNEDINNSYLNTPTRSVYVYSNDEDSDSFTGSYSTDLEKKKSSTKGMDTKPEEIIKEEENTAPTMGSVWNERFQQLMKSEDTYDKFYKLSSLAQDFQHSAEVYGRIIISERYLPNSQKTIKPIGADSGETWGYAGGEKYICRGILFKFAVGYTITQQSLDVRWRFPQRRSCR